MKRCPTCKNAMSTRRVLSRFTGPFCSPKYEVQEYCAYCEWKGTTGPGKQLRELIKEHNHETES